MKIFCIWNKGSTGEDMKLGLPVRCKNKGCKGFFEVDTKRETIVKFCSYFLEDPSQNSEREKRNDEY